MAELKSIEIICIPCHKCDVVKEKVKTILNALGGKLNRRFQCELICYASRKEAMERIRNSSYASNEFPVTLVNGQFAFSGSKISEERIRMLLEGILRY
ncbi:MAG: thioredoxin family protein [Candidatus Omnitrophota bacterium]